MSQVLSSFISVRAAIAVLFALTYIGLAVGYVPGLKLNRTGIAFLGAILAIILSRLPTSTVVGFVNWPTILLLFGFFVISAQLRLSGFFDMIARSISSRLDEPFRFLLVMMLATAGLSAFLNHDIVCYVFTPVIGAALIRRQLNPVPYLIGLAVASNIGAAATVVGNPQDMMIAQLAGIDFGGYFLWSVPPVLLALAAAIGIIWMLSRHHLKLVAATGSDLPSSAVPYNRAHTIKGLLILGLVIGFFFAGLPMEMVALSAAGIHIASARFKTEELLGLVDWQILVMFMSLFVVNGVFQDTGYGNQVTRWLSASGINLQSSFQLTIVTAGLSNLLSNSAAVMLLAKIVNLSLPHVAYVLALANSFGGCLIIIGSVSNIILVQTAREQGIKISFWEFARMGVPVTLAALACLLAWTWITG